MGNPFDWDHLKQYASDAIAPAQVGANAVKGVVTPTKPDLSMATGANNRAQGSAAAYGAERAGYTPNTAPQIGASTAPSASPYTTLAHPGAPYGAPGGSVQTVDQNRQQGALDMMQNAANGSVPSAAQIQTQQNLGTQMANQFALASGLQGRHPGAAFDAAARGAATAQGTAAGQGAVLRAQEQATARDQYGNAIGQARGQDVQTDVANLNAKLTTMGYDTQTKNALLSAQLQAQGYDVATADAIINAQVQSAQSQNQYKGGLWSGGGSLVAGLL